jgi:ProQ/FINO family
MRTGGFGGGGKSAVSRRRITAALRSYCNSVHYLRVSTEGAVRIDLTAVSQDGADPPADGDKRSS